MEILIMTLLSVGFLLIGIAIGNQMNPTKKELKPEFIFPQSRNIEVNIFKYDTSRTITHYVFGYVMDFNEWILVVDSLKKETFWYKRADIEKIIQSEVNK